MAMVAMNNRLNQRSAKGAAARAAACGVALALVVAGCGGGKKDASGGKTTSPTTTGAGGGASGGSGTTAPPAGSTTGAPALPGGVTPVYPAATPLPAYSGNQKDIDKYTVAMQAADQKGMKVWIETDLVSAWLKDKDTFNAAVQKVVAEAKAVPNVVGFKVADELGKADGSTTTPDQALQFLSDVRGALHANSPKQLVMIDVIGYGLGCVPGNSSPMTAKCMNDMNTSHAPMTLDTIDKIVNSGFVDAIDLTTNMNSPDKYQKQWGVTRNQAQVAAFSYVKDKGWATKVILNSRKALSWPTTSDVTTPEQAAGLVPDFIDTPIAQGMQAVDVWSWSQVWARGAGTVPVSLMSPGYQTNALWTALLQEKAKGASLYVHYTPSHSLGTLDQDMTNMAQVFTGVFCAAGTG